MAPFVAFVILRRPGAEHLPRLLRSIASQRRCEGPSDIVLVDMDGSAPLSDPPVLLRRLDASGLSLKDAWQKGVEEARGEAVFPVKADDSLWSDDSLGRRERLFRESRADIVRLPASCHDDAGMGRIADVTPRRKIYEDFKSRGAKLFNLISSFAGKSGNTVIGEASIIGFRCGFSCDVRIGNGNYCNSADILGHDASLGDFNFPEPGTMFLGGATIGNGKRLGAGGTLPERTRPGNNNSVAPTSIIPKGCGDSRRMAGSPALPPD